MYILLGFPFVEKVQQISQLVSSGFGRRCSFIRLDGLVNRIGWLTLCGFRNIFRVVGLGLTPAVVLRWLLVPYRSDFLHDHHHPLVLCCLLNYSRIGD